jgi:hypothetical protein
MSSLQKGIFHKMKHRVKKINQLSFKGKLIRELDKLFSEICKIERGPNCEIHNKICDRVGNMHILGKQSHPKLRYVRNNIIRAGWFCSHYYTHHNSEDPRAVYAKKRIEELRGKDYRQTIKAEQSFIGTMSEVYLMCKLEEFTQELKVLKGEAK